MSICRSKGCLVIQEVVLFHIGFSREKNLRGKSRREKWSNLVWALIIIWLFDCKGDSAAFQDLCRQWAEVCFLLDMCRSPCSYLPERWHTICSRAGGWWIKGFLNHSKQTIAKRISTVSFTSWGWRDLLAQKCRGVIVGWSRLVSRKAGHILWIKVHMLAPPPSCTHQFPFLQIVFPSAVFTIIVMLLEKETRLFI